ncbi:MAG: hypothetical protein ABSB49_06090 [Polyangia bacterium]
MTKGGLVLAITCLACSASTSLHLGPDGSAEGAVRGSGGTALPTGGVTSQGIPVGQATAEPDGGTGGQADRATLAGDTGSAWDDACDLYAIWGLLGMRDTGASLVETGCGPDNGILLDGTIGQLVFNENGQIVDDTNYWAGPDGPSKSDWLTHVAGYRWLCLAGSTLAYTCVSGGD